MVHIKGPAKPMYSFNPYLRSLLLGVSGPGERLSPRISPKRNLEKDIGLFVQEITLRWIFMKICILIDFEVLNNV
jgi:hypothetical protein